MTDFRTDFILRQKGGSHAQAADAQRDHGTLTSMHPTATNSAKQVRRTADRPEDAVPQRTGWN